MTYRCISLRVTMTMARQVGGLKARGPRDIIIDLKLMSSFS